MISRAIYGGFPGKKGGTAAKEYRLGTHRTVSPQETLDRLGRCSGAMGITRVANVTGLDTIGIPVVTVTRPNARMLSVSQGKGIDLLAAKASGLMEAIETYHAERIQASLRLASYAELAESNNVIEPFLLPRPKTSGWHPEMQILWIEGVDIMQEESAWVPYEMVHTNSVLPSPLGHGCFYVSSNGLAGGNHICEAISNAINEVVERDAVTLWHFRLQHGHLQSTIDPATVKDRLCRELIEKYHAAGLSLSISETTADIGIPSFVCRIGDLRASPSEHSIPAEGFGCNPNRAIALVRALTEAAQSRVTQITGSRDDIVPASYSKLRQQDVSRFLGYGTSPVQSFSTTRDFDADTFDEEIEHQMRMLHEAGFNHIVVVSLSSPYNIPVVRVIVPGLENLLNEDFDVQNYLAADPTRLGALS